MSTQRACNRAFLLLADVTFSSLRLAVLRASAQVRRLAEKWLVARKPLREECVGGFAEVNVAAGEAGDELIVALGVRSIFGPRGVSLYRSRYSRPLRRSTPSGSWAAS